jgi:quercetin dioxygenase-like cupin family protein
MYFKTDKKQEFYTDEKCFITEILNTPKVEGMSVAQARVEPGVTTQNHTLDFDEAYYILKGKGEMQINNGEVRIITSGDLAYISKHSTQRITNIGQDDLVFLCLCTPRFVPDGYESKE